MRKIPLLTVLILLVGCVTNFNDSRNESLAKKRIQNASPALEESNISVTSFDGIVLITGQVPSEDLVALVSAQVEPLRNVRRVYNELTVAGNTALLSRTNDLALTAKARLALGRSETLDSAQIKVVTENAVVYLIGRVTRAEADAAVEASRTAQGVQKIVKIFEYIN